MLHVILDRQRTDRTIASNYIKEAFVSCGYYFPLVCFLSYFNNSPTLYHLSPDWICHANPKEQWKYYQSGTLLPLSLARLDDSYGE